MIELHMLQPAYIPQHLLDIIQNLPQLKTLFLESIEFLYVKDINISSTNITTQLTSLHLDIGERLCDRDDDSTNMAQASQFYSKLLQLCPLLESFQLDGALMNYNGCGGVLSFDFTPLIRLTHINMQLNGHSYYKLNVPGKKKKLWANYDTVYNKKKNIYGPDGFCVELTWLPEIVKSVNLITYPDYGKY